MNSATANATGAPISHGNGRAAPGAVSSRCQPGCGKGDSSGIRTGAMPSRRPGRSGWPRASRRARVRWSRARCRHASCTRTRQPHSRARPPLRRAARRRRRPTGGASVPRSPRTARRRRSTGRAPPTRAAVPPARGVMNLREQRHQLGGIALHVVVEAGDQQRIDQRRRRRDAHRLAVQPCAVPALGGEQLAAVRIEDRRDHRHAADLERDRAAEDRQAVRVVGGAVDRIEDPAVARDPIAIGRPARTPRRAPNDRESDPRSARGSPLDRHVDVGDEVDRALLVDLEVGGAEMRHLHARRRASTTSIAVARKTRRNRLRHRRQPAS